MSIFQTASRQKLRFASKRGTLTTEDLWELPLTELDSMYRELRRQQQENQVESLLNIPTSDRLDLPIQIIKTIVEVRQTEAAQQREKLEREAQRQRIMEKIKQKQDQEWDEKSLEVLEAELKALS